MAISTTAVVQGGMVTIPVGNVLPDGKRVSVTIVESVPVVPEIDLDIELDEYVRIPPHRHRVGQATVRVVHAQPNLVGIGSES
jgi:hypothetical protein